MSTCSHATTATEIERVIASYVAEMLADPGSLRGQQLRGGGPVGEFERLLAERTGFPYCLATSSGTSALLVAALAADLGGKKIAVAGGAWEGSLGALEFAGAEIVEVESLLTTPLGEVSAVLATDRPSERHDARYLRSLCDQAGISYIEDTGWIPEITAPANHYSLADIQVVSFGPGKRMSLGEGGALLCRERSLYERSVALSQHPERAMAECTDGFVRPPINARIHPLAALIGQMLLRSRPLDPVGNSLRAAPHVVRDGI